MSSAVDPVRLAFAARDDVVARMKEAGLDDVPVVVGGIIPPEDEIHAPQTPASPRSIRRRISS